MNDSISEDSIKEVNKITQKRSLVLKLFDWIVLLLYDENLSADELQFGSQKTSTTMCTWLAVETIHHYVRNGSEVFVGVMDMPKTFDNVRLSQVVGKADQQKCSTYISQADLEDVQ